MSDRTPGGPDAVTDIEATDAVTAPGKRDAVTEPRTPETVTDPVNPSESTPSEPTPSEPTPSVDTAAEHAGPRWRSALLVLARLLGDVLVLGLWVVVLTLGFLATGWPRWGFYTLAVLGVVFYVLVTVPWWR